MSHNYQYCLLGFVDYQRVMTYHKSDKSTVIGNQRVMTTVGRFPSVDFGGVMAVGSSDIRLIMVMRQFVNGVRCVCHVVSRACSAAGEVGAFFCRGGGHPRRTGANTYPSQKGSNTFSVCPTLVKSSLCSLSTGCNDVKLSDNIMSWWSCADNCADNCADKLFFKVLCLNWLCNFLFRWCADNCADNCANTKEKIRRLIRGRCWGWGLGVAYG